MKKIRLILLIVALTILAGCSFSFTTANITNAAMTTNVVDGKPVDTVTSYTQDAEVFYVGCILNNAPDDTNITFVWKYDTDPQIIDTITFNNEGASGVYVYSNLNLDMVFPLGDYSVDIYIDDREKPDATVKFTVE